MVDNTDEPKFGPSEKKILFDEYIKEYVILYLSNNSFAGRLECIEEGYAVLNPHQSYIYEENGNGLVKRVSGIAEGNLKIRLIDIIAVQPINQKYLRLHNRYTDQEYKSKK